MTDTNTHYIYSMTNGMYWWNRQYHFNIGLLVSRLRAPKRFAINKTLLKDTFKKIHYQDVCFHINARIASADERAIRCYQCDRKLIPLAIGNLYVNNLVVIIHKYLASLQIMPSIMLLLTSKDIQHSVIFNYFRSSTRNL